MLRFPLAAFFILALALPVQAQTALDAGDAFLAGDYARAAEISEPLAQANDPDAIHIMAQIYGEGLGGYPVDHARALDLYSQAAALGSFAAQSNLGRIFQEGLLGQDVDRARAEALYLQAIEGGSERALNNYATLLEEGPAGTQDWAQILDLYERAAAVNDPHAASNLALVYYYGTDGIEPDPVQARVWAEQSLLVESTAGMVTMGSILQGAPSGPADIERARALFTQAHEGGNFYAAFELGELYELGAPGVPIDVNRAAQWYEIAAKAGDALAQTVLAFLLSDGDPSLPDDGAWARELYALGHAGGNEDAAASLGILYSDGIGGAVDLELARQLFTEAVALGSSAAMNDLAVMFQTGEGGPIDQERAAELYRQSAQAGHPRGANNLALILAVPDGKGADPVEGLAWCQFSLERAFDAAAYQEFLQVCVELEAQFSVEIQQTARARSLELLAAY